jgi:hypothetical protein
MSPSDEPGTMAPLSVRSRLGVRIATIVVIGFVLFGALRPQRGLFVVVPGDGPVGALPVTILDDAGLVLGVEAGPLGREGIVAATNRTNAVVYQWLGGLCDRLVTIRIDRLDGQISLLRTDEEAGTTCLLAGIERSVVIEFREPIDPSSIVDVSNTLF